MAADIFASMGLPPMNAADMGVAPPPPSPPPVPTTAIPKPMLLALLAGTLLGGKRTTGFGAGVLDQAQDQTVERQRAWQLEQQAAQQQQVHQERQQAEMRARGQTLANTLLKLKADLAEIPDDRARAEQLIDQYGQVLTLSGFPGFDGNALRQKGFRYYPASVRDQLYTQLDTLFKRATTPEEQDMALGGTVFYTDPKDPTDVTRPMPVQEAAKLAKYPIMRLGGQVTRTARALTPAEQAGVAGAYQDALDRLLAGGALDTPDTRQKARAQAMHTIEAAKPPAEPRDERLVQIMGPAGAPIWVRETDAVGKPAAQAARAVTGIERQSLAFFNRANEAAKTVVPLEMKISDMTLAGQARLQAAPNWLQSAENQSYRQAQRAFTEARLRKESGAAIPSHEYENDAKTYFAQPGDGPRILAQKQQARLTVLDGLAFAAGKAYDEFYGEPRERAGHATPSAPRQYYDINGSPVAR